MAPYKSRNIEKEYYTISEISEIIGFSITRINDYVKCGAFPKPSGKRKSTETKPARIWDKKTINTFELIANYAKSGRFTMAGLRQIREQGFESLKISDESI